MSLDPNRTQLIGAPSVVDPNRTQAMGSFDPMKTSAMAPMQLPEGLKAVLVPGREATMANGPAREQFLLDITAGGGTPLGFGGPTARTPMNLCLVIDRSGSMEGAPLEYVKQACTYVLDMLTPNDILSIVTFEETVDVLMPPQRVSNKEPIKAGIGRLMAGNTTDLYGGIALGAQQLAMNPDPGRATRMIVLSDGDPTTGIKDFQSLVTQAGDIKTRGVTVTFLGFGPDYNEELLAGMARRSGGNYYFIPRPEMIPDIFRQELEKLMTVVAKNLKIDLKLARWVSLRSPSSATSGDIEVPLTDLERGAAIQQVFDFEFQNHPLGWYRVASGRLTWDDIPSGTTKTQDIDFVMEFTSDTARYSVPVNPTVAGAAQVAFASRAVEKTVMGLKTGMITQLGAIQELQKTQMLLVQEGRTGEAQEVTMALRAIQTGDVGSAEKTLMGTMHNLDQGKRS